MVILKTTELVKVYNGNKHFLPTKALNNLNMEVREGSFTAIMGPSGSGKSTLLNILCGLRQPTSGEVLIMNQDIHKLKKDEMARFRRNHLGFVYQDYNLMDGLTVRENIMLPRILEKADVSSMQEKANYLMNLFSIEDIADKLPQHISGGQQQRCAIARALMNDTTIVFADEPTGNLDSKSAKTVMRAFERANVENNATILMVTHDPYTASCSGRVIFIKDGCIATELYKKDTQKEFFNQIIDHLAALEGENCDI